MGKFSLLLSLSIVGAVTVLAFQGEQTAMDTSESQAQRQGEVIARQIARSGYNSVLSEAHQAEESQKQVEKIVSDVDTIRGKYEGGTYEAWLEKISPSAYKAVSVGRFSVSGRVVKHKMGDGYVKNMPNPPEIDTPSRLKLEYSGSGRTGYCSAVYLQRTLPDRPSDEQPDPEQLYPPSDEKRSPAIYDNTMQAGTKINFILAVYEKQNNWDDDCGGREGDKVALGSGYYDQTYRSFKRNTESELRSLQETGRSIVEEIDGGEQDWRVAFEGYEAFSKEQLWDIKENGYPTDVRPRSLPQIWNRENTYGGDGWEKDSDGLLEFEEGYQYRPDFNDEVFRATTLKPPSS
jgi:hypothetical protein